MKALGGLDLVKYGYGISRARVGMRTRLFDSLYMGQSLAVIRRVSREGQLSCFIISIGPVESCPIPI
jgi:hypothetical protein